MPFDPDKAIAKLDSLAAAQEETKKVRQRPFFGLPPTAEKIAFPRAVETREKGGGPLRTAIPGALDIISAPGRAIAALPALVPGGETFVEAFGRRQAKPQKGIARIGEFIGTTIRDPITAVSGFAGAPIKTAAKTLAGRAAQVAGRGATAQAVPAITRQIEESARTGRVDIPRQLGEAGIEIGLGAVGETAGAIAAKAATKAGQKLLASSAKIKDVTAKIAGSNVAEGLQQTVNDVAEFGLESPLGNFGKMAVKADKKISIENKKLDDLMNAFAEQNPETVVDIDEIFVDYLDDIENNRIVNFFGKEDQATKTASNIHKALEKRGLAGEQPVINLRKIKKTMAEGLKLFKKGKFQIGEEPLSKQVGELAHLRIADRLNEFIPEAKQLNDNMRRLITTKKALIEAHKRTGNHNFISLRTAILAGGGVAGIGGQSIDALLAGLAASAALGSLAKGRGASALIRAARGRLLPTTGRILTAEGRATQQQLPLQPR